MSTRLGAPNQVSPTMIVGVLTKEFTKWVLVLLCFALLGCDESKEQLRIGFVGALTGRYSDLGISGRDGVILAVEEKNRQGGLLGRPIGLLSRDDRQDPLVAWNVDEELAALGVIAIVGHMTSSMSAAVLPLLERTRTVMISPTTSSPLLSGKDDLFFRVYEPVEREVIDLAHWVHKEQGVTRIATIYDIENRAFAQDYAERFERAFRQQGGQVLLDFGVRASNLAALMDVAYRLSAFDIDAVLIVLNALDTVFCLEKLKSSGWKGRAFASAWSMTRELLEQGGQFVEGLQSIVAFLPDHPSENFKRFREGFLKRFRRDPDFPAVCGYEAAQVVFAAYQRAKRGGEALARAIVEIREFEGLQSKIEIDEFGDARREKFRVVVRNGKMERVR